jgi:hypothetical protein
MDYMTPEWRSFDDLPHSGPGFYYLATPYSKYPGGLDAAAEEACRVAGAVIKRGLVVYSPIAHSHAIAHTPGVNLDAASHEIWMRVDEVFVDRSMGLIVVDMDGWRDSKGVGIEIGWCRDAKKPMFLLDPVTMAFRVLL